MTERRDASAARSRPTPVGRLSDQPKRSPWWNLRDLNDSDLDAVLGLLDKWVAWLVDRYDLARVIPPCWHNHGAMVEELLALRLAWQAAYENTNADPGQPLQWHVGLDLMLRRFERRWGVDGCRPDQCMLEERERVSTGA